MAFEELTTLEDAVLEKTPAQLRVLARHRCARTWLWLPIVKRGGGDQICWWSQEKTTLDSVVRENLVLECFGRWPDTNTA